MVGYGPREGISRFIRRSQHQQEDAVIPPAQPTQVPPTEAKDATKDRAADDSNGILHQPLDDRSHVGHL